jgi:hypothetical protein
VRAHIAGLQDALQVAAADPLHDAVLDGTLAQYVKRGERLLRCPIGLARQGDQLQPLRLANPPRTSRASLLLQTSNA